MKNKLILLVLAMLGMAGCKPDEEEYPPAPLYGPAPSVYKISSKVTGADRQKFTEEPLRTETGETGKIEPDNGARFSQEYTKAAGTGKG